MCILLFFAPHLTFGQHLSFWDLHWALQMMCCTSWPGAPSHATLKARQSLDKGKAISRAGFGVPEQQKIRTKWRMFCMLESSRAGGRSAHFGPCCVKWLPAARFKGNVLDTLHRSCMPTEQRPPKGVLWDRVACTPLLPLFLSFLLFLSFFLSFSFLSFRLSLGVGVHAIGCLWPLIYRILWEVTIFGTLEMFTPKGGQQPKYLEYFILSPDGVWHPHLSHEKKKLEGKKWGCRIDR